MAVIFSNIYSQTNLLNSFNNNIAEFSSTNVLQATKAKITVGTLVFEITPINNAFHFNLKEVFKSLLAYNNTEDNITPTAYVVGDSRLATFVNVTYEITLSDLSTESIIVPSKIVRSVEQINNKANRSSTLHQVLSPLTLKVWKGYPFGFSYYADSTLTITNTTTTNSINPTVVDGAGYRVFFIDREEQYKQRVLAAGGTFEQNNCWLERTNYDLLNVGHNTLMLSSPLSTITMNVNMIDSNCDGITYLKWFNEFGGWSYWLFNPIHKESVATKTVDSFNVDFSNLIDTSSTTLLTGKTARKTRDIKAESLTNTDVAQLKSIITSPRVEMFDGTFGNFENKWQNIKVKDGSFQISNTKRNLLNLKLKIEINQYTQV